MIYLVSPYWHVDAAVHKQRFHAACRAAANLTRLGHTVFSPIARRRPFASFELATDWRFWERFDWEQLARCDEAVVLTIDGWPESEGAHAEVRVAANLGKPVRYLATVEATGSPKLAHVAKEAES